MLPRCVMPAGQAIAQLNCGLDSESCSSGSYYFKEIGQMKQFAWPCIACPTALASCLAK